MPDSSASSAPADADSTLSAPLQPSPAPEAAEVVGEDDIRLTRGPRQYRVRGLARNLSAQSLKVTLRLSDGAHLYLDTLDLYQARGRHGFAKGAAVELGVAAEVIGADLSALVLALEPLQEQAIRGALAPDEDAGEAPALSEADEAAGLELLRDPDLAARIVADVEAIGVVGEADNALIGYLAMVSRLLVKPLAILIQSTSAAGKSTLMDALLSLMPEGQRVHYSAMTGQSLFYLGEGDLRHKILAIAEEEGVRQAAYALKLLQSQGELTIASTGKDPNTGKLVTSEYHVAGPVMLCLTTTAIDIDEELLNRCIVLTINETAEQTAAIQGRQRQAKTLAGLKTQVRSEHIVTAHRAAQTLLEPLAVVNPYAEKLTFASDRVRLRRDHVKYLALIDAIALLHQHQRKRRRAEVDGETVEYIEVAPCDIELANRLAHAVLGRSLDELPPQTRRVLAELADLVTEQAAAGCIERAAVRFTRRQVRQALGLSDTQLRVHLDRLVTLDYVALYGGKPGQRFSYSLLFDGDTADDAPQVMGLSEATGKATATAKTRAKATKKTATSRGRTSTSRGQNATSRGEKANLAGGSRAGRGGVAAGSRGSQTARKANKDAASEPSGDIKPQNARSRRTQTPLNGHAAAPNGSAASTQP